MSQVPNYSHRGREVARLLPELSIRLLGLWAQLDLNDVDRSRWSHLVRQLCVIDAVSGSRYVAVAGEQGAGKTTLMRALYPAARDWLPEGNIGRGEKYPVTIVERQGLQEPRGLVTRRLIRDEARAAGKLTRVEPPYEADRREHWRDLSRSDDDSILLIELEVPFTIWHQEGAGFVLLPGLERGQTDWQQLMQVVLAVSPAAVIVTDERRMANKAQHDLLKHVRQGGLDPRIVVAVNRCDDLGAAEADVLAERAAEVFAVPREDVIPVGKEIGKPAGWAEKLFERVDPMVASAGDARRRGTELLGTLVKEDLRQVIRTARQARDREALSTGVAESIREILHAFDAEAEAVKADVAKAAAHEFGEHAKVARERLTAELKNTGGLKERRKRTAEFFSQRENERDGRLAELVRTAWWGEQDRPPTPGEPQPSTPVRAYAAAVNAAVDRQWEVVGQEFIAAQSQGESQGKLPREVAAILGVGTEAAVPASNQPQAGFPRELLPTVRALPVAVVAVRGLAIGFADTDGKIQRFDAKTIPEKISEMGENRNQLLGSLGVLLGSSAVTDGDIDIVENAIVLGTAVFGAAEAETLAGAAVAGSVGALAAVGLLTAIGVGAAAVAVLSAGNNSMKDRDKVAFAQLDAYQEAAEQMALRNASDLLDHTRSVLEARLRAAYRTDDQLSKQLSLDHAISELAAARDRLIEALSDDEMA